MGAKQCVVDKVQSVKQQQQAEIRLTRGSPRGILIADQEGRHKRGGHGQEGSLGSEAEARRHRERMALPADGVCSQIHLDLWSVSLQADICY